MFNGARDRIGSKKAEEEDLFEKKNTSEVVKIKRNRKKKEKNIT